MRIICLFIFAITLNLIGFGAPSPAVAAGSHTIKILVNDSPISSYDIQQRTKLFALASPEIGNKIRALLKSKHTQDRFRKYMIKHNPRSKAQAMRLQKSFVKSLQRQVQNSFTGKFTKRATDELINEQLMLQEAKRLGVAATKSDINKQINIIAKRSQGGKKKDPLKAFVSVLKAKGVSEAAFRARLKAAMSWQKVIRAKYGREVALGIENIERELNRKSATSKKEKLDLRKIIVEGRAKTNSAALLASAENIQKRFTGCSNIKHAIAPFKQARIINMGMTSLEDLPPPANVLLADAKIGQLSPPKFTPNGIEMIAVCDRRKVKHQSKEDKMASAKLRQSEYQKRAQRYLRDLRQDAIIEHR